MKTLKTIYYYFQSFRDNRKELDSIAFFIVDLVIILKALYFSLNKIELMFQEKNTGLV